MSGLLLNTLGLGARAIAAPLSAPEPSAWPLPVSDLLIAAALAGAIAAALFGAILFTRSAWRARRVEHRFRQETAVLRHRLAATEALLAAEPQALIVWAPGQPPHLACHTLSPAAGAPDTLRKLLRFSSWMERDAAIRIERALSHLRNEGMAFNQIIPVAGDSAALEADGRTYGGLVLLRFRALGNYGQERAEFMDRHQQAEETLAAHRALFEALPVPVWFRGPEGLLVWVNKAYSAAVEAEGSDDVIARQFELFESRQRRAIDKALATGSSYREQVQTIVAGERRSFDAIAIPIGQASAGAAIDVAPLESAKGELERQMAAHARTLDRVATAIAIFGADRRLGFFNDAFVQLWRLDPAWLGEHPYFGAILDQLRSARLLPEQADYRAWRGRQLEVFTDPPEPRAEHDTNAGMNSEDWWHLPDGRTIHVAADLRPDGGVTMLYDDVSEKIALESRYNALIRVQRETLDHLQEAVAVFGPDGKLRLFNPPFAETWHLDSGFLYAEPHIDAVIARCQPLIKDSSGNGVSWDQVHSAVTGVQEARQSFSGQLDLNDRRIFDYAGVPLPDGAMLLTYVDVTDKKRVEWALIERNEALEAADRLKTAFISHVSYELRTPLTNIIGFSELLGDASIGALNPRQQAYLDDIRASSQTLLAIINDILDLTTMDAGALELKLRDIAISEVIDAAALGVRERLRQAHLQLDIQIAEGLSRIVADDKRLIQILYNLLSNAIGFSSEGDTITLSARPQDARIAFSVQDTGCGIPEEYQASVFERFESRPHGSRHRGAGLGLSVVKSLVELHDGEVELRSTPGEGTTVTVLLPQNGPRRSESADAVAKADQPENKTSEEPAEEELAEEELAAKDEIRP